MESEKKSLQREVQQCKQEIQERKTKESLDAALFDEIAKQIADLMAENTRLKVCAESSTADRDRGAEDRLSPNCKIRLGTNGETSRVSTAKFTVLRHKNRSCKCMEDMYCDSDYNNVTPTRCSVLITLESGDELISLCEQFIGRAEQHLPQHTSSLREMYHERSWLVSSALDPVESRVWTGLCGRSCCGLRIQQPSLVDANEFALFSQLTRNRMMSSF